MKITQREMSILGEIQDEENHNPWLGLSGFEKSQMKKYVKKNTIMENLGNTRNSMKITEDIPGEIKKKIQWWKYLITNISCLWGKFPINKNPDEVKFPIK